MVFTTVCSGISTSALGAPSPHPSQLILVSAGLFLIFSLLLSRLLFHSNIFSFLNLLLFCCQSLMSSALASVRSLLELAGSGFKGCRRSSWYLFTEDISVVPSQPKTCLSKQIQFPPHTTQFCPLNSFLSKIN